MKYILKYWKNISFNYIDNKVHSIELYYGNQNLITAHVFTDLNYRIRSNFVCLSHTEWEDLHQEILDIASHYFGGKNEKIF